MILFFVIDKRERKGLNNIYENKKKKKNFEVRRKIFFFLPQKMEVCKSLLEKSM